MDRFDQSQREFERRKRNFEWQRKMLPGLMFWGCISILCVGLIMMCYGTLQAFETNNNIQIQNNALLWPIVPVHIIWLLASRYSKNSLPSWGLVGCVVILLLLPLISGFINGPADSAFYAIGYGFTFATLIVSAVAHFTLRKASAFSDG
ncbi:MAG: hypothetical protein AAFQ15_15470 [Pseudomonadota bacterium]